MTRSRSHAHPLYPRDERPRVTRSDVLALFELLLVMAALVGIVALMSVCDGACS